MERLIDKGIVALCCLAALLLPGAGNAPVAGLLVAVAISAFCEVLPKPWRRIPLALFCAAAVVLPPLVIFIPLAAYDCMDDESWPFRLMWLVPLVCAARCWSELPLVLAALFCAVAALLSWRTGSLARERARYKEMRDGAREKSLALEERNRSLQEAGDLAARVATLSERGRIAREIHDNVGHLLTRAIMQVEAMKVVHADDPGVSRDFAQVGETLDEAMRTVRASVHDLRDESLDVEARMRESLEGCGIADTRLEYEAGELPADVGTCFLAIVREALSNTARHSDATGVRVSVIEHPGLYQLVVQDNGTGSGVESEAAAGAGTGMGLQTMEDRVRALGGTFRTERRNGFRVFASIPK